MGSRLQVFTPEGVLVETIDTRALAEVKAVAREKVNTHRDMILDAGFYAVGRKWDSNERARTNVSGFSVAVLLGLPPPTTVFWRDYNNEDVGLSYADFKHMAQMLVLFNSQVYAASWFHKTAIDALTNADDVEAYDFTIGWPDGDTDGTKP